MTGVDPNLRAVAGTGTGAGAVGSCPSQISSQKWNMAFMRPCGQGCHFDSLQSTPRDFLLAQNYSMKYPY